MIKAVIFDMDGTVLNTIDDIHQSVNVALQKMGYPLKSLNDVKRAVGSGAKTLIERVVPIDIKPAEIKKTYDIYQTYYDKHSMDQTAPYQDILKLLKTLKGRGYQLAVVSNKHQYLVKALNDQMFEGLFEVSVGEIKGVLVKPAPDMLYSALNQLNINKEEAIFVGDSDIDMITAKNADMISVAVTWGFRDLNTLKSLSPHFIINQPLELLELLERI